nr:heat shock protein beta-1-like [Oncorhynchus nerka]
MADHNKVLPRPLFRRDVNWDPFREWTQPSHMIMEKDSGLSPFLDPGDVSWIDWARNTLASSSWPGYKHYPLFSLSTVLPAAVAPQTSARLQRQLSGGVSAIRTEQGSWRFTLDVNHFSPEEISIKTKGGFLEIAGQHDEREDEHGSVSRCFIRKNK